MSEGCDPGNPYVFDANKHYELYHINSINKDSDNYPAWLFSNIPTEKEFDDAHLFNYLAEKQIIPANIEITADLQTFIDDYYEEQKFTTTARERKKAKARAWRNIFGRGLEVNSKFWASVERIRRFRNDYDNIKRTPNFYAETRNIVEDSLNDNEIHCVYLASKYIIEDGPRSMLILVKIIKDTVVIKYTVATRQGWYYRFEQLLEEKATDYYRESIVNLFVWTIEQLKMKHPNIRYGAIEAATPGSQRLMDILNRAHGYSTLTDVGDFSRGRPGFEYTEEDTGFDLPPDQDSSISLSFGSDEPPVQRPKIKGVIVFEFCQMCAMPPAYTCGEIKCCSRKCAEKYYK